MTQVPPCNCGKGKTNVQYEVNFNNGAPNQKYATITEAQSALQQAGRPAGSSFRAVPK